MHHFDFKRLENITDIAQELGCTTNFLEFVIDHPDSFYNRLLIPKKRSNEHRIVYEVDDKLKNLHKNILISISVKVCFPEYVQGFVPKRSIVTNASLHLAKKYLLNLDVKDFFESIKIEKVTDVFIELGCNNAVANVFAQLCTFNKCLVQGANTSPILANLVCKELDKDLVAVATDYDCSYSRYADDITFSGETLPKKKKIESCIKKYGFNLNPDKYKIQSRGKAQYVTGLTVFDQEMPRIPKQIKRKLRQKLYYMNKYGLLDHAAKVLIQEDTLTEFLNVDGWIAFMYSVEPDYAYRFDIIWQAVLTKSGFKRSRDPSKIMDKLQVQKKIVDSTSSDHSSQEIKNINQVDQPITL